MSDCESNSEPRALYPSVMTALNKIKRPSAADKITELLYRDLGKNDEPFRAREVAQQLEVMQEDVVLRLFWLRSRPAKVSSLLDLGFNLWRGVSQELDRRTARGRHAFPHQPPKRTLLDRACDR